MYRTMDFNIDHVAKLAKLTLTPEEREMLATQLPSILDYIGQLKDVDTSGVDPKAYLTSATNVFRDDVVVRNLDERDALVAAFPKRMGDALEVPGVFAE